MPTLPRFWEEWGVLPSHRRFYAFIFSGCPTLCALRKGWAFDSPDANIRAAIFYRERQRHRAMKIFTRPTLQFLTVLLLAAPLLLAQEPDSAAVLTLKRAVALAIQNSRDIALARVQYSIAQSEAGVNRADFRPNLYTGSGAAYTSGFPAAPGGQGPSIFNLSYSQALYDPLSTRPTQGRRGPRRDPKIGARPHPRFGHCPRGVHLSRARQSPPLTRPTCARSGKASSALSIWSVNVCPPASSCLWKSLAAS